MAMATATATTANPPVVDPVAAAGLRPIERLIHASISSTVHPNDRQLTDTLSPSSLEIRNASCKHRGIGGGDGETVCGSSYLSRVSVHGC